MYAAMAGAAATRFGRSFGRKRWPWFSSSPAPRGAPASYVARAPLQTLAASLAAVSRSRASALHPSHTDPATSIQPTVRTPPAMD